MHEQSDQLITFVKQSLAEGHSEADIRATLQQRQFSTQSIDILFASARRINQPETQPPVVGQPRTGMFDRRVGRLDFFLGGLYVQIPSVLIYLSIFFLSFLFSHSQPTYNLILLFILVIIIFLLSLLQIFISISLTVRRLHDFGRPWKLLLIDFIPAVVAILWLLAQAGGQVEPNDADIIRFLPIINIVFYLYVQFMPGDKEPNKYGHPTKSHNFWVVLGFKKSKM